MGGLGSGGSEMGSDYETLYEIETEAGAVFRNVLSLPLPSSTVLSPAFTAALLATQDLEREDDSAFYRR